MSHFKKISPTLLLALLTVAGLGAALAGIYLLWGTAVALVVGGLVAAAAGLLVDVD